MNFDFTEEQTMIMDGISRYVREEYDFDVRRIIKDSNDGYSKEVWRRFSELGWLSIPFDEVYGGFGGNPDDLASVMIELGKGAIIEPYVASIVLFGALINESSNESLKKEIIPKIINGDYKGSFAYIEEQSRFEVTDIKTSATKCDGGYTLRGQKLAVIDADKSNGFIVSVRTDSSQFSTDGISLFLVEPEAQGVSLSNYKTMDGHSASVITFEDTFVSDENLICAVGNGYSHIKSVMPQILLALCSEALGIMETLNKLTVEYSKTRTQFGSPIGSFQALQHRMVDNFMAYEQAKSMVYRGLCEANNYSSGSIDLDEFTRVAHAVKALVAKSSKQIGDESIQIHGGIGMTDELNIGHLVKRLMMINVEFGDGDFHQKCFGQN